MATRFDWSHEPIPKPGSAGVSPAWPGIFGGSGIHATHATVLGCAGYEGRACADAAAVSACVAPRRGTISKQPQETETIVKRSLILQVSAAVGALLQFGTCTLTPNGGGAGGGALAPATQQAPPATPAGAGVPFGTVTPQQPFLGAGFVPPC